jgi:hypothetical protein
MDTAGPGQEPTGFLYVPDWLVEALGSPDAASAMVVLANAGLSVYDDLDEAQKDGDHEVQKSSRGELDNIRQAITAFMEIDATLRNEAGRQRRSTPVKEKREREREGDDAIRIALKCHKATINSDAKEIEFDVRAHLLKAASVPDANIGFLDADGELMSRRGEVWKPVTKHALVRRIETQLQKLSKA